MKKKQFLGWLFDIVIGIIIFLISYQLFVFLIPFYVVGQIYRFTNYNRRLIGLLQWNLHKFTYMFKRKIKLSDSEERKFIDEFIEKSKEVMGEDKYKELEEDIDQW